MRDETSSRRTTTTLIRAGLIALQLLAQKDKPLKSPMLRSLMDYLAAHSGLRLLQTNYQTMLPANVIT